MVLDLNMLPSLTLKKMVFIDTSDYGDNKVTVTNLEITPPGFNKVNVPFTKDSVNVYDSISFNTSCSTFNVLPDGVYKVKYSLPEYGEFIERSFLRTALLECKFGKVLLSFHLEDDCFDKTSLTKINEIRSMIEAAISAANNCDNSLAMKLYNKASKLLDRIKKCSCYE